MKISFFVEYVIMFSVRNGVFNLSRVFSQKSGPEFSLKTSIKSHLAKNTITTQPIDKEKKKEPMSREKYMPSFDEYCQKIALPTIRDSGVGAERAAYLSKPEHLLRAYRGCCNGCYRGYLHSLNPMNPFIL